MQLLFYLILFDEYNANLFLIQIDLMDFMFYNNFPLLIGSAKGHRKHYAVN